MLLLKKARFFRSLCVNMSDVVYFHKCSCGFSFYMPPEGRRNCRVCGTWYSSHTDHKGKHVTVIERPKGVKVSK